jgi:Tfp pilus assembly protein PilN
MQTKADQSIQFQVQQTMLAKEITKLNDQLVQLKGEIAKLSVQREKHNFSGILARIAATLPASVKCSAISLHGNGGEIEGVAMEYKDLPAFAASLKNDGLFKTATLHDIGRGPAETGNRFSYKIIFELN